MRTPVSISLLTAALCLTMQATALAAPRGADDVPPEPQYSLPPGYVGGVPLSCFAPDALQGACGDLFNERYFEAAVEFRQALKKDRDDLIAWVGLMQSDTKEWGPEMGRQRGAAKGTGLAAAIARFKVGTLLFYRWSAQPAPAILPDTEPVPPGRQELQDAWRDNKALVIGMLLLDTYLQNDHKATADIVDPLLLSVVGEDAQKAVHTAEQAKWQGDSPAVKGIPIEKLRPLWGLVRILYGDANQRPRSRVKRPDGTVDILYGTVSPDMAQKAKYMKAWRTAIEAELKRIAPDALAKP